MHHWEAGGAIAIGWPDYEVAEREYTIVELERYGPVLRGRVSDGRRQGGFLVVFGCPDLVLEMLARRVSRELGFAVVVSDLRCSIEGTALRSFDYEWYPTPEYAERPSALTRAIAGALEALRAAG